MPSRPSSRLLPVFAIAFWAATYGSAVGELHCQQPAIRDADEHPRPEQSIDQPNAAIGSMLEGLLERHDLPGGMIAGIVHRDRLQAIGAAGYRKHGSEERVTIHDKVHIGSCTKAMTATMIATLVEEGELAWDSTLGELMDDVDMHASFRHVTLRQLLGHRAGVPRNASGTAGRNLVQSLGADSRTDREIRRDVVADALDEPPLFTPGSKYSYSNLGYVVAGHLAERASDASWEQLMRERLFQPLGIKSAGFGPPGEPGKTNQPWGHANLPLVGWTASQRDNPSFMGPAGTVHCTLADWARFASLHLGYIPAEMPLLTQAGLTELHKPVSPAPDDEQAYALGWSITDRDWAKGRTLTHAGSNTMWYAIIWVAPRIDCAFLVAANSGDGFDACDEAIGRLIEYAEQEHWTSDPAEEHP